MSKINLLINYYIDKNIERQKEIDYCFNQNLKNPFLNVCIIQSQDRVTFNKFFDYANSISESSDINIIANSDIYFDQTIELTKHLQPNHVWCLSRWDIQENRETPAVLFDRPDSQDCMIWRGKTKCRADFVLGFRGSDNRICKVFEEYNYEVSNPSKSVKSYHLHLTGIRNYDQSNKFLVPGPYKMIYPTSL